MNFSQKPPSPKLMILTEWTVYKQLSILIRPSNSPEPFTLTYERSKVIIKPIPNLYPQFFDELFPKAPITKVDDTHRMDSLQAITNTDSSQNGLFTSNYQY